MSADDRIGTMPIAELVDVCEAMAARHRHWFEVAGRAVAGDADAVRQRWLAAASHRHAWHEQLWRDRRPAVPIEPTIEGGRESAQPVAGRIDDYEAELARLRDDTASIGARVDRELDPSTHRTVTLVLADLDALVAERPA